MNPNEKYINKNSRIQDYGRKSDISFFSETAGAEAKYEHVVFFQEIPGSNRGFSHGISAENTFASSSIPAGVKLQIHE
ncbi:MAG: hypothetical protein PHS41_04185 [Victivallaceae bacterium]|nr:hypothetical protein [Victivallaceae bacterium]